MKTESTSRHWLLLDRPTAPLSIDYSTTAVGNRFQKSVHFHRHLCTADVWNLLKHGKSASDRRRWM